MKMLGRQHKKLCEKKKRGREYMRNEFKTG
jgi:hypothetical protein